LTIFLVLLAGLGAAGFGAELEVTGSAGATKVSVVRRVELDYHLVTRDRPLAFTVTGPAWLRVYTRLWWPQGQEGNASYTASLWQEDVERPLSFQTARSSSSYGPGKTPVARWRSFFIQVPSGRHDYRLELTGGASDRMGVRLSFQKPAAWEPLGLGSSGLALDDRGKVETAHLVSKGVPLEFEVAGPCRMRIRSRLSFDPRMEGSQNYVLKVRSAGKTIASRNLRTDRSGAVYSGAPGIVPGKERAVTFALSEGTHRLFVVLEGTLAAGAGIIVERIAGEKYE